MNLNLSEIKQRLKNWHFYKAYSLSSEGGGGLEKQLNAIERAIEALDECDAVIIRMRYFDRYEVGTMAKKLCISRQAVYKRMETILARIAFCLTQNG